MDTPNQAFDIPQEDFETIEKYVLGEMDVPELSQFEHRLNSNPTLIQQVAEVETLITGSREAALRIQLDQFHQDLPAKETITQALNPPSSPFRRYAWAAAIALLCVSGIWFLLQKEGLQTSTFAQYYKPDPGLISRMSTDEFYEFNRGMVDYKSGKYANAIKSWQDLQKQNLSSDTLNYFLGSAFLADKQAEKAIPYFEALLLQEKSSFYPDALWYLALAHLLIEDDAKARFYLEKSSHPDKEAILIQLKNDP